MGDWAPGREFIAQGQQIADAILHDIEELPAPQRLRAHQDLLAHFDRRRDQITAARLRTLRELLDAGWGYQSLAHLLELSKSRVQQLAAQARRLSR